MAREMESAAGRLNTAGELHPPLLMLKRHFDRVGAMAGNQAFT